MLSRLKLSTRISLLLLIALSATAVLLVTRSELVLEEAILAQTKQKVRIFLQGLEQQLLLQGDVLDAAVMLRVMQQAQLQLDHENGFSIKTLYSYDRDGRIYAFVGSTARDQVTLQGHYLAVLQQGRPYMGDSVDSEIDPLSGQLEHSVDIIIPLRQGGEVVAGLEAEINLDTTMLRIRETDDAYEEEMLLIVCTSLLLALLVIWWAIRRGLIYPIRNLVAVTQKIAAGELTARSDYRSADELGSLATAVNVMADSIEALFNEQEQAYLQTLQSLAKALEAKDRYTASHSSRVAKYSVMLGRRLGLDAPQLKLLKQGALMHDLGKIGISDAILNKPAPLSDEEYEIMRHHPVMTASIMRPLKRFTAFAEIAAWHHERWDGAGYPDGLKGEEIPLLARIVAIADTWDAMTGDRVYRKGMSVQKTLSILEAERESGQWDPELLRSFIDMLRHANEDREAISHDMFDTAGAESVAPPLGISE
jgi:putative nucleotidyltransferase with HDIG domain